MIVNAGHTQHSPIVVGVPYVVPYNMVKTTVYLPNDLAVTLRQMAISQGRTQAELIRDALETYAKTNSKPVSSGFGKYSSGETDVSERAEEILMDAAKRGRWR